MSGLPTTWAGWEDPKCSMLLLEEVGGRWFPLTPPVTGLYDSYGRIEQDDTGHYRLCRGADDKKDQSYFLFTLGQAELAASRADGAPVKTEPRIR